MRSESNAERSGYADVTDGARQPFSEQNNNQSRNAFCTDNGAVGACAGRRRGHSELG
jgi:hypothetical protein